MGRTPVVFALRMVILASLLLGGLGSASAEGPPARPQVRAFWVNAFHDGAKTPEQIDKLVMDAASANVNTLVVQVRRRGDAYYFSDLEPRTQDPAVPADFDVLQYLIERAHAQGIEVHAWLNTLVAWNSPIPPVDPNHMWNLHGPNAPLEDNWVSYYRILSGGEWSTNLYSSYYFDPGHPACADYTTEVYVEVVKKYDVDGIHLDYARYNGTGWGYNPVSVWRYNERYGTTGMPHPTDPTWMDWRREQANNLMRKIYLQAVAIKPGIKVSCATIAWGAGPVSPGDWENTRTYTEVFQDWKGWLEEGIIDLAMPMNYDREWNASQKLWFDQWIEWEKNLVHNRQVVIGPALYFNYIEQSLAQIARALAPSSTGNYAAGVSLYSYASANVYGCDDYKDPNSAAAKALPRQPHVYLPETNAWFYGLLTEGDGYTDPVLGVFIETQPVFPAPAAIPDMPWKSTPAKGFLMGTVADLAGKTYEHLELQVINQETGETHTVHTDGSGWYGLADVDPGHYKLTIGKEDFVGRRLINARVQPGLVTEANFAQFWEKDKPGYRYEELDLINTADMPDPFNEHDAGS